MSSCVFCKNKLATYQNISGYDLFSCNYCGLLVTDANKKDIKNFVVAKYNKKYALNYNRIAPKLYARFKAHLDLIHKFKNCGKLLDIGCGTGHFLQYLSDNNYEFNLYGVEPSNLLRDVARNNTGLKIKNGVLSNIPYKNNYFDVVTCYDVLEHSVDLRENILEIKRVIKPGGLFLVQAPNYKSFMAYITGKKWDWWCIPDHVLHFSYYFLTNYLRSNGFRILKSYTYEDKEDFFSNIKGVFSLNYLTKIAYVVLIPLLIIIERIGWLTKRGGLILVLAQKL